MDDTQRRFRSHLNVAAAAYYFVRDCVFAWVIQILLEAVDYQDYQDKQEKAFSPTLEYLRAH